MELVQSRSFQNDHHVFMNSTLELHTKPKSELVSIDTEIPFSRVFNQSHTAKNDRKMETLVRESVREADLTKCIKLNRFNRNQL